MDIREGYVNVTLERDIEVVCKECGLPLSTIYNEAKIRLEVISCSNCIEYIVEVIKEQKEDDSIEEIKKQLRQAIDKVLG